MSDSTSHQRNPRLSSPGYVLRGQSTCQVSVAAVNCVQDGAVLGESDRRPPGQGERRLPEPIARSQLTDQNCLAQCRIRRVRGSNGAGVLLPDSTERSGPICLVGIWQRHQRLQPGLATLYTVHPTYTGGVELSTLPTSARTRGR